ncbi:MAG: GAF domain-containing protein [Phycisphaerales bacterium]|nr:GAF domain-containing protein [Phycisphaerales bacterium]
MASIRVIQGPDKGRTFELRAGDNVVGRENDATIVLNDQTASRAHSCISVDNGQSLLSDVGSANGTFLNGVRIGQPTGLKRGDQVRCGSTLLVFQGDATGTSPATGTGVDIDENGMLVDSAIVATVPSSEDSVIIPTPEAGVKAIDNLRNLYRLIADISTFLNLDDLVEYALEQVFDLLDADRGFVMLIDDSGRMSVKASKGTEDSSQNDVPPVSHTIIDEVVKGRVGILSSNAMSDKRFAGGKSVHNFGIRSAICVPLMGRDRVLGVIQVDCSIAEKSYSTEQLRLLTAVGYQAGLAIENVQLYQAAVQSERLAAVGETVAFLSHNIKNILQALNSGIDVVEIGINARDMDRVDEAWPIVERGLDRINALILNMLAFSKDREPLLKGVDVAEVLRDCVELSSPGADERQIALITELPDMMEIPADASGLHQAFLNLIANALDAVEDEVGAITVSVRLDTMNRCITVQVSDNGSGIDPARINDIFTPFFSSKGQKGTGLGLAVTKKIVEEHHGQILVSSAPSQGTTFTIHLPIQRKSDTIAGQKV